MGKSRRAPSVPDITGAPGITGDGLAPVPGFAEATRLWLKVGLLGFGGPSAQIALMHRLLVE